MTKKERLIAAIRAEGLTDRTAAAFRRFILGHFRDNERPMPWRSIKDPYGILVSEVMLQQTQVERVLVKYPEFLAAFPDFASLAAASTADVLKVWQGMGYNRRAVNLKALAAEVVETYDGRLPLDPAALIALPGLGKYSASAIYTFATNRPSCFIETNIRRLFIHFFFSGEEGIRDGELEPLIEKTLDRRNPRRWYYALMDYGALLRKEAVNPNRRSAHYVKQSKFEGSRRQIRSRILRLLLHGGPAGKERLRHALNHAGDDLETILAGMLKDCLISEKDGYFFIPGS